MHYHRTVCQTTLRSFRLQSQRHYERPLKTSNANASSNLVIETRFRLTRSWIVVDFSFERARLSRFLIKRINMRPTLVISFSRFARRSFIFVRLVFFSLFSVSLSIRRHYFMNIFHQPVAQLRVHHMETIFRIGFPR